MSLSFVEASLADACGCQPAEPLPPILRQVVISVARSFQTFVGAGALRRAGMAQRAMPYSPKAGDVDIRLNLNTAWNYPVDRRAGRAGPLVRAFGRVRTSRGTHQRSGPTYGYSDRILGFLMARG